MRSFAASGESSSSTGDDKSASALLSARVKQIEALTQAEVGSKQAEIDIKKAAAEADLASKQAMADVELNNKKAMAEVTLKKALLDLQKEDAEINTKKAMAEVELNNKKVMAELEMKKARAAADIEIAIKHAEAGRAQSAHDVGIKKTVEETEKLRSEKISVVVRSVWKPAALLLGGAALALLVRLR